MTYTEADLRQWEESKLNGSPLPPIPAEELVSLWEAHGFDPRVLEPLRLEFADWRTRYDEAISRITAG